MSSEHQFEVPSWRRLPIGAEVAASGGVHFRVWAPKRRAVAVAIDSNAAPSPLRAEGNGYFSGLVAEAAAGTRYRLQLDGGDSFPDPAARFQPDGPHGASQVVDPSAFRWTDRGWPGVPVRRRVVYELHVGTFSATGDWAGAMQQLPALAELGVTVLEVMPVAEFAGRFGWGYDGVDLFAPYHHYGAPDDFRRFVDRAHALGLGVILDVVYNHLGPDGNYLRQFADEYFAPHYATDWGEALNFDGASSHGMRELCLANVRHWIEEYHLDGLRLDATQNIYDASPRHILREIAETARRASGGRTVFLVAENEPQLTRTVRPVDEGGFGLDAMWNDDWHHSAHVALTGRDEAYYADYAGMAWELVAAATHGLLYQGQWYSWQGRRRGTPTRGLSADRFVHFLENHDQVANSFRGDRLHRLTSPSMLRAMTALLLLGPQVPQLFQGQEFAASNPFLYFADHHAELADPVTTGRRRFLSQFESIAAGDTAELLDDPCDPATFERCRLDHAERERHAEWFALHRDLLALRRGDAVFAAEPGPSLEAAVLGGHALALRFHGADDDRLLIVNLGSPLRLDRMPAPLLAPPEFATWALRWSSENAAYGGHGTPGLAPSMRDWRLPGGCAVLLAPEFAQARAGGEPTDV
ncbi:MAG TPA: malto-oligosyltrehalose trehalohydrolase [Gemmatimonadaceae bacterium]